MARTALQQIGGRQITLGRSRKLPTDRNMCALKLMPRNGNTSTREKRVGENWIEELYSPKTLTKNRAIERRAATPGRRDHLFFRIPAVVQRPDAMSRVANTCNGRILASSRLAPGRATSTQVSRNSADPIQPAEVHAALWARFSFLRLLNVVFHSKSQGEVFIEL